MAFEAEHCGWKALVELWRMAAGVSKKQDLEL